MKYLPVWLTGCLLMFNAQAAQDFACMQDCFRQGYDRSYCVPMCNTRGGGMPDQPGLPKNPAFDQVQPDTPRQRMPSVADPKCMKDCQRRGYNYMLCQKQCAYSFNER